MAKDSKRGADPAYDHYRGMTIREAFAMAAMQGILADPGCQGERALSWTVARAAVQYADALLAALAEEKP